MNTIVPPYPVTFSTDYRQFYIVDLDADLDSGATDFWTKETTERGMALGMGGIAVSTASYGNIRLFFEVTDKEPTLPLAPWDRVMEDSLIISTGRIGIMNCTDNEICAEQHISPGDYRIRVHKAFLRERVDEEGYSYNYHDFYWIVVYPTEKWGFEMLHDTFRPGEWSGAA